MRDPWEGDQLLSELIAFEGITEPQFERVLGDADGARGGLHAGALEGRHQLLEALAFDPAEEPPFRHRETVEGDLVFLHAAIAEDPYLGAAHALGREWLG